MKISIITVSFNSAKTIERTIKSVLSQNYEKKEYIIIDGASVDGTTDIIKKYERKIDYWVSEPDGGIFDAMNKGISRCTGEIIAFMNSDDCYAHNQVLANVAKIYENSKFDILCGSIALLYNGEIISIRKSGKNPKRIWIECIYGHQAMFSKKELFVKYKVFSTAYRLGSDYEWMLRMHCLGVKVDVVDEVYANYSLTGLSGTYSLQLAEEFKEIAMSHITSLNNEYLAEEVEKYHDWKISFYKKANELKKRAMHNDKELKQLFINDEYYIWGTGKMGIFSYELLKNLGIKICGFIDNNVISNRILGCSVVCPKQADYSKGIFISVLNAEAAEDIMQQIKIINPNKDDCILLRDLVDSMSGT